MELTGRVIIELPLEEGVSRAGNHWRKQSWVLETFGTYPRKVKVDVFGNRLDTIKLEVNKNYTLSVDAESREFNGRWYTDISCYSAREGVDQFPAATATPQPAAQQPAAPVTTAPNNPFGGDPFAPAAGAPGGDAFENSSDDLPF